MSRAPLGAGLELDFERPAASAPHEPEPPELRGLVGADVLLSRGWRGQDADHRLHCVALPSLWLRQLTKTWRPVKVNHTSVRTVAS